MDAERGVSPVELPKKNRKPPETVAGGIVLNYWDCKKWIHDASAELLERYVPIRRIPSPSGTSEVRSVFIIFFFVPYVS